MKPLSRLKSAVFESLLRPSGENRRFEYYREYLKTEHLDVSQIQKLQLRRLRELLQHVRKNIATFTGNAFRLLDSNHRSSCN